MSHHLLLIIHLLSATIWVGGHLLLVFGHLPQALKEKNQNIILNYEKKYEPVGMTALILLVTTGILMAYKYGISIEYWFQFSTPIEKVVSTKLLLLLLTFVFAFSAHFSVFPKFRLADLLFCFIISGGLFFGPMIINEEEQALTQLSVTEKSDNSEKTEEVDLFELKGISLDSIVGTYTINEKTVQLTFQLGPKGGVTKGAIKSFSGQIEIKKDLERSTFEIELPVANLTTFNSGRDESIFEKEYFNLEKFPSMYFSSKHLTKKDDSYELDGQFTMLGVKKPLKVELRYIGMFDSNGSKVPVLIGKSSIDRTQFGMQPDSKEGNIVDFEFKVELIKK